MAGRFWGIAGWGLDPAVFFVARKVPGWEDVPRAAYTPPLRSMENWAVCGGKWCLPGRFGGGVKTPPYKPAERLNKK